jgi:cell division transport system permease protein
MTRSRIRRARPIIPASAGALRSLTVAMAVMCYLACLAIGALLLIDRAVSSWTQGLAREVTVQVRQLQDVNMEEALAQTETLLKAMPGVTAVTVLEREAGMKLLEPWLGNRGLEDLPIPRLIRVEVDDRRPPDYEVMRNATAEIRGASLDTHRRWQSELTRMARALSILSYTVLILICLSAIAIVIFGTRAVLQENRPIVDLLHLVGARDGYIARQIDGRFLKSGLLAGFIGVLLGLLTFFLLSLSGMEGSGGVADASRRLLFAPPQMSLWTYGLLFAVPAVATLITLLTSRLTLIRMLRRVL